MKQKDIKVLKVIPDLAEHTDWEVEMYEGIRLLKKADQAYMVLGRTFTQEMSVSKCENMNWDVNVISYPNFVQNSFIVDMNGIDNFITAKAIVFHDYDIRKMVPMLTNAIGKQYVRFGVSGSRPNAVHPGGEVVEFQELDYVLNMGTAKSVSGYMDYPDNEYSEAVMLSEDGENLREERTVYSHTAWIEKKNYGDSIKVEITPKNGEESLLTFIYDFCREWNLDAAGIKVTLHGNQRTNVKGRVLKEIPKQAFKGLQEATDIAVEKEFVLPDRSQMQMYGSIYKRFEPEWKEFTEGRQYERRGHFHACITGEELSKVHQAFHVREIMVHPEDTVILDIYPIRQVYRFYPLLNENGSFYIASSHKEIRNFAKEYEKENFKL